MNKHFLSSTDKLENWCRNIPLMLTLCSMTLLDMMQIFGINYSMMMTLKRLRLTIINTKDGLTICSLLKSSVKITREMLKLLIRSNMKFGLENGLWQLMYVLIGLEVSMMETLILNSNVREFHAQSLTCLQIQPLILIELLKCLDHLELEIPKMSISRAVRVPMTLLSSTKLKSKRLQNVL